MGRRRSWVLNAAIIVAVVVVGLVVRNQVKVYRGRQLRDAVVFQRQLLFDMLQPVALSNCRLERFGEANDGGYLMCGNLLTPQNRGTPMASPATTNGAATFPPDSRYRSINTTVSTPRSRPVLPAGRCFTRNASARRRKLRMGGPSTRSPTSLPATAIAASVWSLKIDVEGAEWDSFLTAPDDVLQQIDQMAVEFHEVQNEKYVRVVHRLKELFHVAHLHFNNHSCIGGLDPFPTWAYEVLFVNKRLSVVDPTRSSPAGLHPLDAPNNPAAADCQPAKRD